MVRLVPSLAFPIAGASQALAQPAADSPRRPAPNSDLPLIPICPLKFTNDEGMWMPLDVSLDGKTIVFDLLGDLSTLPISHRRSRRRHVRVTAAGHPRNEWLGASNPRANSLVRGRAAPGLFAVP